MALNKLLNVSELQSPCLKIDRLMIHTLEDDREDDTRQKMSRHLTCSRCSMNFSYCAFRANFHHFLLQGEKIKRSHLVRMQQLVLGTKGTTSVERAAHPQIQMHFIEIAICSLSNVP